MKTWHVTVVFYPPDPDGYHADLTKIEYPAIEAATAAEAAEAGRLQAQMDDPRLTKSTKSAVKVQGSGWFVPGAP